MTQRNWFDFKNLNGGIEGARSAFEKACETLIRKIHPNQNVQQIQVKLGDGGIDIYVGELGIEPIIVYQCKFFLNEFGSAQQAQIRNSFKTAISSDKFELKRWYLCIPKVLNIDETLWFSKWKNKQIKNLEKQSQFISLINGNELIDLMKEFNIYNHLFNIEEIILARETNKYVTQLVNNFNPVKKELPKILWSKFIGRQKWKNTPIILGDMTFVGSCGNEWNKTDDNDGIYCLDNKSGKIIWFFKTENDIGEISYYDGEVIGGCDNGIIYCISSKTGSLKWKKKLKSGIVSKIYKHTNYDKDVFICTCYDGSIYFLNTKNGNVINHIEIKENIMANILYWQNSRNTFLFIPTVQGNLYEFIESYDTFNLNSITEINYPSEFSKSKFSKAELYSKPLIFKNKIFIAFVRDTYYNYPAIICLDLKTKEKIWYGNDDDDNHYGNIRTELIIENNELIFTHPYSNELVILDYQNGKVINKIKLGRKMFQQWSSPIVNIDSYFLGRHDGYLYKIDKVSKKRIWGIYLGQSDDVGVIYDKNQSMSNENEKAAWKLFKGYSIFSTPTFYRNGLIIGTDEGILYFIDNI